MSKKSTYPVKQFILLLIVSLFISSTVLAEDVTIGLLNYDTKIDEGYTLLAPRISSDVFLIDNYGHVVHSWSSPHTTGMSAYLMEDGSLVRAVSPVSSGGDGGGIEIQSWDGQVLWMYPYELQHHDIEPLPNGNILILANDLMDTTEAISEGRDPATLGTSDLKLEKIIEVKPIGTDSAEVVWEWYIRDHLVQEFDSTKPNYGSVQDHPELIDFNTPEAHMIDWLHANHVAYNADLDQIVISLRAISEVWIIDHSTTTAEAAGHSGGNGGMGGDIIYRWGNPQIYQAGDADDQKFFDQHNAHWIADGLEGAGNIMVFCNGKTRPSGQYSTVEEITPPVDMEGSYAQPSAGESFEPEQQQWIYTANPPENLYSVNTSGAQRLPNGNTLICSGVNGILTEITPQEEIVWTYINPIHRTGPMTQGDNAPAQGNSVFKVTKYPLDYAAFDAKDLSPRYRLELYPIDIGYITQTPEDPTPEDSVVITAKVESDSTINNVLLYVNHGLGYSQVTMFDDGLHNDQLAGDNIYGTVLPNLPGYSQVKYYIQAEINGGDVVRNPAPAPDIDYNYTVSDPGYVCGDANNDESVDISDAVYLINFAFGGGPIPQPTASGDPNCDLSIDVSDAVFIINYSFGGGASPCDPDDNGVPDC